MSYFKKNDKGKTCNWCQRIGDYIKEGVIHLLENGKDTGKTKPDVICMDCYYRETCI